MYTYIIICVKSIRPHKSALCLYAGRGMRFVYVWFRLWLMYAIQMV